MECHLTEFQKISLRWERLNFLWPYLKNYFRPCSKVLFFSIVNSIHWQFQVNKHTLIQYWLNFENEITSNYFIGILSRQDSPSVWMPPIPIPEIVRQVKQIARLREWSERSHFQGISKADTIGRSPRPQGNVKHSWGQCSICRVVSLTFSLQEK